MLEIPTVAHALLNGGPGMEDGPLKNDSFLNISLVMVVLAEATTCLVLVVSALS